MLGQYFIVFQEHALELAGKSHRADKIPENDVRLSDRERCISAHWLFIHIVRNPFDTSLLLRDKILLVAPSEFDLRDRLLSTRY